MTLKLNSVLKWYVVSILMLQYFVSIRISGLPLITIPRILLVVGYAWFFFTPNNQQKFWDSVKQCNYSIYILIYAFVCLYTAVLRRDSNTFLGYFIDCFLFFYLFQYILRYQLSISSFLRIVTVCLYIVCALGMVEFATGFNVFTAFGIGENDVISTSYRDNTLRISGPYGHPLAYGMVLLILFPLTCYNYEENTINVFKNKTLLLLATINVLCTGARSGVGLFALELVLLYLYTSKRYRGKAFLNVTVLIIAILGMILILYEVPFVQYILRQVFYVIDEIFGTKMALLVGGDSSIAASSIARDRIWKILQYKTLNPWLGRGTSNIGSFYIDGWNVTSIDNFFVRTYVSYGIPGVVAILLLYGKFIFTCVINLIKKQDRCAAICLIAATMHFVNLLYVDELATYKYFYMLIALSIVSLDRSVRWRK